jgi:hypothetical protein
MSNQKLMMDERAGAAAARALLGALVGAIRFIAPADIRWR